MCLGILSDAVASDSDSGWDLLAPLPDAVGFSGMFAGVLQGQLIAGGGARWDKPSWNDGIKFYSDKLWSLASPESAWKEVPLKLPIAGSNFANAATSGAIYLAGGVTPEEVLKSVYVLRQDGEDRGWDRLADLPSPLGYACASIVNGRLYVIGGLSNLASRSPSREVWSLKVGSKETAETWQREADLPGRGVFVPMSTGIGMNLYVFGGMAVDDEGHNDPSRSAYCLNSITGEWRELADLPEPRVGAITPAPVMNDGRILVAGGYSEVFHGSQRDHPGFDVRTFLYDPETNTWSDGPHLPKSPVIDRDAAGDAGPAPMLGAPSGVWRGLIVAISGEVRSSVRSPQVLALPLSSTVVESSSFSK